MLDVCRVFKTAAEVETMRYVALVASNAHVAIMRAHKEHAFEFDLEAKFKYQV